MDDIVDIIREEVLKQMGNGEWESLPIAAAGFEPHVKLIHIREYVPGVFGGYMVIVWTGENRNLILPEGLNDTVKFYTVAGTSPLVISDLYDLLDNVNADDGKDGIISVDVPVICKGTVSLVYMSPSNMAQYESFDDVRDKMASYVADMIKTCWGYILCYNNSFIDIILDKLSSESSDDTFKVTGNIRFARLDELLGDMELFDRFLPDLMARRAYYVGFMDYIATNWPLRVDRIPFPSSFNGQLMLLESLIQFDRTDPKSWFDKNRDELVMTDILNPFIKPEDVNAMM